MAAVTVASVIVLFFLPLGVIGDAVGLPVKQPVEQLVGRWYYDYLQFVLQVPKTVNAGSTLNQKFTIHGLWPSNYNNDYITNCGSGIPFTQRPQWLSPGLQNELLYSWPDVERADHRNFWTREYNAHGKCANSQFRTPKAYFEKAYFLYRNRIPDLYRIFLNSRSPSLRRNQVYRSTYFTDLKTKNYMKNPVLRCNGTGFLMEVIICYDNAANQRMHCGRQGNCPQVISYPI